MASVMERAPSWRCAVSGMSGEKGELPILIDTESCEYMSVCIHERYAVAEKKRREEKRDRGVQGCVRSGSAKL